MRLAKAALLGFVVAAIAGCAPKAEFIRKDYSPPVKVAVLPFDNASNSLDAPDMLRRMAAEALGKGGYEVLPLGRTDEVLKGAAITQSGQARAVPAAELARKLGVAALLYGEVRSFNYTTLAVYQKREVALGAELVDAQGARMWKHSAKVARSNLNLKATENLGEMAKSLGTQLAFKAVEKVLSHPLYPEMRQCTHDVFMTLPSVKNPKKPVGWYFGSRAGWTDGTVAGVRAGGDGRNL